VTGFEVASDELTTHAGHLDALQARLADVSAEAVGPGEVQRFLGDEREGTVPLEPGAKVLVTAPLAMATFTSEGRPYGYFDGMTGSASVRLRRETILFTLVPALRQLRLHFGGAS